MNVRNKNKNGTQKRKVVPIRQRWWHAPFYRMVVHVVQTTVQAVVIGLAAFGLNLFADWLQAHGASDFLVQVFHGVEDALLVIDVVWFLVNIILGIVKEWFDD